MDMSTSSDIFFKVLMVHLVMNFYMLWLFTDRNLAKSYLDSLLITTRISCMRPSQIIKRTKFPDGCN
jgi:hypothetical protein